MLKYVYFCEKDVKYFEPSATLQDRNVARMLFKVLFLFGSTVWSWCPIVTICSSDKIV